MRSPTEWVFTYSRYTLEAMVIENGRDFVMEPDETTLTSRKSGDGVLTAHLVANRQLSLQLITSTPIF